MSVRKRDSEYGLSSLTCGRLALRGRARVTREIVESPLYLAARDVATRAGMAQGLILAPRHEKLREQIPTDRSLMSVVQAADLMGVSRAAVYNLPGPPDNVL